MRALALIFLLPTIGLLAGAAYTYTEASDLASTGERVTGTVVSIRSSTDSEGSTTYAPVYSYQSGGEQRQYSPDATSSFAPDIGDTAVLFVDPDDPSRVMADTFMDRWFLPVLLGGIGAVFLVVTIAISIGGARMRRRAAGPHTWSPPSGEPATQTRTSATTTTNASPDSTTSRSGPFVGGDSSSDQRGPFL